MGHRRIGIRNVVCMGFPQGCDWSSEDERTGVERMIARIEGTWKKIGHCHTVPVDTNGGEWPRNIGAIFIVGGVGALLHAIPRFAHLHLPFVVLSSAVADPTDTSALVEHLRVLATGTYTVQEYPLLVGDIIMHTETEDVDTEDEVRRVAAFHEIRVERSQHRRPVRLRVAIDDTVLGEYIGDGLLITSAEGSRVYAPTEGQSVTDTNPPVFCVAPTNALASSSFTSRQVLTPRSIVTIKAIDVDEHHACIVVDSTQLCHDVASVRVSIAPKPLRLLSV